jgi:hypothetical protein
VSRVVFVMLHPGFIRYYDHALQALAAAGHDVHLAFEITRSKLGEDDSARRFSALSPRLTCGTTPSRPESVRSFLVRSDRSATRSGAGVAFVEGEDVRTEAWESLATTVRLMLDYLRYFEPAFERATALRARAGKRLPRVYVRLVRGAASGGRRVRAALASLLHFIEDAIPPNPAVVEFVRRENPTLLLVTPLIELGSQQVDYVKAARLLGVRSALAVASWDNLTSKGLIRVVPDHVIVWNDAQKAEAEALHGVARERVAVTGAQVFDRWFDGIASRTRERFCADVGLDPARPFVLYVGSSMFIAPEEVPFFERWLSMLRGDGDPVLSSLGVLVRPHPANSRQWRALDTASLDNVALWPRIGTDFNDPDFHRDFFDSMYFCAAVIGINTSALLEAGIVGRPVFTIAAPEFAHAQEGTIHFHHLVNPEGGLVQSAASLDEHVLQLRAALRGETAPGAGGRAFVQSFIRPLGLEQPAAPIFAHTVAALAGLPPPAAVPDPLRVRSARVAARPLASLARLFAEDRPLWVYAARPVIAMGVWTWAAASTAGGRARGAVRSGVKRTRRRLHRASYELAERTRRRARKVNKRLSQRVRSVGSLARRVARRQLNP